jgi:nucleotide-binding universal stress UspA family protein
LEPELDGQTFEEIERWIRHHSAVGEVVVVLLSHGELNEYRLDEIKSVDRLRGSVRLVQHGRFNRLGKGSSAPRGTRLRLLISRAGVLQSALEGKAWLRGKFAFARPLSEFERKLADRARLQFITVTKKLPPRISDELRHYMEIENLTGTPDELVSDAVAKILADAEKHARKKGLKQVQKIAQSGPVARTIAGVAKRQKADLIVMGCRGLGEAEGLLLGSVSHKVVCMADCPVMTVR